MLDPDGSPISFGWPDRTAFPLIVPWPTRGNIGGMLEFRAASEWLAFLRQRDLHPAVPLIVAAKYRRAQKDLVATMLEGRDFKGCWRKTLPIFVSGGRSCLSNFIRKAGGTFPVSVIGSRIGANMTRPFVIAGA
jgi:hypothetical protein